MKTTMSVLAIVALVAVIGLAVQPASAANVDVNTAKVVVMGGPQGGVISVWRSYGGQALAGGAPTGLKESATPVALAPFTEVFVPFDEVSNVFVWTSDHGYRLLQTVAPNGRGQLITLQG